MARAAALLVPLALAGSAGAAFGGSLLDLLQPGSRSAPALGGDPFLSPLEDGAGWWGQSTLTVRPEVRVGLEATEPVSQRATQGRGDLARSEISLEGSGQYRPAGVPCLLAGRFSRPSWAADWRSGHGGLRLGGADTRLGLTARTLDLVPGLTLQAEGGLGTPDRLDRLSALGGGLRYRRGSELALQASWDRTLSAEILQSDLYSDRSMASANLRRERRRLDGRMRILGGAALEGSFSRTFYREIGPLAAAPAYQLFPGGEDRLGQASVLVRAAPALHLLLRYTGFRANLGGEAAWGGQRFGRLTRAEARLESVLLGLQARTGLDSRWLLDWERVRADGRGRGWVEFWPFTPATVDLLGPRRLYKADAAARWIRLHAAREWRAGPSTRWQAGLGWIDLRPTASLDSWRPTFLVFGVSDLQSRPLGIRRAQLAVLSLGGRWKRGETEAALHLQQVVFARAFRPAPSGAGSPATPGPSSGPQGPGLSAGNDRPGGSQVVLQLTRKL